MTRFLESRERVAMTTRWGHVLDNIYVLIYMIKKGFNSKCVAVYIP